MKPEFFTLAIDHSAIAQLASATFEDEWFRDFLIPPSAAHLRRAISGNAIYILSNRSDENSKLLVIRIGKGGVFERATSPRHVLDRILHVALSTFEKTVLIPVKWRSYNDGALLSIYAQPEAIAPAQRLYFHRAPLDTNHLYTYALTDIAEDFSGVPQHLNAFKDAMDRYLDAVVSISEQAPLPATNFGITLTEPLGVALSSAGSLSEWIDSKLTRAQKEFVLKDHSTPVRLRGPAGSGKTQAMAVKCLHDAYQFERQSKHQRIGFITHSAALAHQVVPGMLMGLDPEEEWRNLRYCSLTIGSLYEIAQSLLEYERKNLEPLSLDGKDGRDWQAMLIDDAINDRLGNTRFALSVLNFCGNEFSTRLRDADVRTSVVLDIMNEFASVIDAEGIRLGSDEAHKYVGSTREAWQMKLSPAERTAILHIHDAYCLALERSRKLSMDQMIADLNRYLVSHEWRQLVRDRRGFDVLFVDEFHYFNSMERMVFHNLIRTGARSPGGLPIFMAYDMKQSTGDASLNILRAESAGAAFKSVRAGETALVELKDVFRYSPQIAKFLSDIDGAFPALNLGGEWSTYQGASRAEAGDVPQLARYNTNLELIDGVFSSAVRAAQSIGGRRVAVLCVNDDLFGRYLSYGRISGKFTPLTGRDQVRELQYAGRRPVFSTPDYVSGLQFDEVFLIHVDRRELSDGEAIGPLRRLVSRCYLGASRAKRKLTIATSIERGGEAVVLEGPLNNKSVLPC